MPRKKKPKKPDRGEGREALLAAAAREFADAGFRGASVSRIARETGVTQPLINHHFGSKAGLYRAVIDWLFEDIQAGLDTALDPCAPVREQLYAVVGQAVRFFARRPELARIVKSETNHPSEGFDHLYERYLHPMTMVSQALIRRAKDEGEIDLDERYLHFVVVGAAMQPFTEPEIVRRTFGADPFSEEFIAGYEKTLLTLVQRGVS